MHLELICSPDLSYYIADDTSGQKTVYFFKNYNFHHFSYLFIVKQSVGLRDWYSQISKALNPVLVQNPEVNPIVKKQLSNIMSLDPEERGASDVEQIYQVKFENAQRTDQKIVPVYWVYTINRLLQNNPIVCTNFFNNRKSYILF